MLTFVRQAEKLARDPLRYMRDPSMLGSDVVAASKEENDVEERSKSNRKSRVGFNKRMLKNHLGDEQCFEEARALAGAYNLLTDSSSNFNLLRITKMDQSSHMDLEDDGECSIEISMVESESRLAELAEYSTSTLQPKKLQRLGSKTDGIRLFQHDVSVDAGLNQTATSNASSTINILDAVGLPATKEEETINTKLAMKELSMMFSSPAFGVDGARRLQDQSHASRIDENFASHSPGGDTSFDNVGDSLGNVLLDNSICNIAVEENRGVKLKGNSAAFRSIGSGDADSPVPDSPLKARGKDFDGSSSHLLRKVDSSEPGLQPDKAKGFQIFDENNPSDLSAKSDCSDHVENQTSFRIYQGNLNEFSAAKSDFVGQASRLSNGDTASIAEAMFAFEERQASDVSMTGRATDDDDTATLSLFNDVFRSEDTSRNQKSHPIANSNPKVEHSSGRLFEIYMDGDDEEGNQVS